MKMALIIARNTYREIIRDRILYGLVVFALLLIGFSLALGQLSFAEQSRISSNFGFTAIHLSAVLLSIFVGSTLVSKEIEKKTVLTLLARPISRLEFLLGKSLGLAGVVLTVCAGLALVLALVFFGLGMNIGSPFFVALYGIFLESLILLGFALFFSSFSSPFMVVSFSIGLFLIGHWIGSLEFFTEKSDSAFFTEFGYLITVSFPRLEYFNWRGLVVYDEVIALKTALYATVYSVAWFCLLLALTSLILRRKDFA